MRELTKNLPCRRRKLLDTPERLEDFRRSLGFEPAAAGGKRGRASAPAELEAEMKDKDTRPEDEKRARNTRQTRRAHRTG